MSEGYIARWGAGVVVVWEDKRRKRQCNGVRSGARACLKHAHPLENIAIEAKRGYFIYVSGANWEMGDGGGGRDGAYVGGGAGEMGRGGGGAGWGCIVDVANVSAKESRAKHSLNQHLTLSL